MSTSRIVAFSQSHVAPFCEQFNALPGNNLWNESSVSLRTIHDPAYDPQLMVVLEQDAIPVAFLLANIADDTGWIRAFLVHPDLRRTGIGTIMFDTIEERLVQRGIKEVNAGWARPNYFLPGIDINYTPAIVFLDHLDLAQPQEADGAGPGDDADGRVARIEQQCLLAYHGSLNS